MAKASRKHDAKGFRFADLISKADIITPAHEQSAAQKAMVRELMQAKR